LSTIIYFSYGKRLHLLDVQFQKRFVLFIALAMIKCYREIILDNRMDFTDIIRFFNEMAERHDAREILRMARELVLELQRLIDNK